MTTTLTDLYKFITFETIGNVIDYFDNIDLTQHVTMLVASLRFAFHRKRIIPKYNDYIKIISQELLNRNYDPDILLRGLKDEPNTYFLAAFEKIMSSKSIYDSLTPEQKRYIINYDGPISVGK